MFLSKRGVSRDEAVKSQIGRGGVPPLSRWCRQRPVKGVDPRAGRIAQLRYAVSFGQPIQLDKRANALAMGELQLRRAPRKQCRW